jgi:hypothetical protein
MHSFAVLPKGHNRYFLWFEALSLRNRSPSARFGHAYAYAAGMQDAMNIRAHWQLARHCYDSESNILPDIFPALAITSLFGCSVGWCWFVLREEYCWLVAGGWFVLREKYCWLVADKPSEQAVHYSPAASPRSI